MNDEAPDPYRIQQGAPGLCGTTPIVLRTLEDGRIEARMGISLFGYTNLDEEGMRKAEFNPFHPEFHDNFVVGFGATDDEAMASLQVDLQEMHQSLW